MSAAAKASRSKQSLDQALVRLAEPGTDILAGGTDWYPALNGKVPPAHVIDVRGIDGFDELSYDQHGTRIGAGVTWSEVMAAGLPPAFDGLIAAAHEIGSVQIQNAATLVGNLCNASPAADGVPALMALDASVELASVAGRRVIPLDAFITGVRRTARQDDELVSAILVPPHADASIARFDKLGSRRYLVISIAMVSTVLQLDAAGQIREARIAVGSCSPVAQRLRLLEDRLRGRQIDDPELGSCVSPECLDVLAPIDDVRGSAQYRLDAVVELLVRQLSQVND